ncbi:hypothetical protein HMPREF0208_01512 [Citrobacter koseri]|uniref:Uncharacterized protein n=1 Tax=Citrobacter koseri (strain ATCC BAA-895 / CDC 4225-83 / SGSC4696) TaxID=290338 RepID=A8ADC0_CITK8|nr:hypothetical protein CKO_00320 [Citrobacter koseri ATCC BAA-895]KWZ95470.1 hypothetical protein HMPREF3220_04121 [Citrobacter koseri]KXA05347.1 hypothetical protein HMPREF3207_00829 [Citrobacter koseri]KXB45127.1 hypothetical protein HMPREF0208_01512 [Citrobacter koseri]
MYAVNVHDNLHYLLFFSTFDTYLAATVKQVIPNNYTQKHEVLL